MKRLDNQPLVFVDLETTGLNPIGDRIIDVGIVRWENGKVIREYTSLVNPGIHLPPEITAMTGITGGELSVAPMFPDILREVKEILEDAIFIAHNARFDYGFLKNEFARYETKFVSQLLCTAKLSRKLFPHLSRHNLDTIIQEFGITCEARHRAMGDAYVLVEFYKKILSSVPENALEIAIGEVMKRPSLPSQLPKSELEKLPDSPGTYTFYNRDGLVLYVGKSKNIKDRVSSHFSSDYRTPTDMKVSTQVTSIDYEETAGEIGALIRESAKIKSETPLYNRMLRRNSFPLTALKKENPKGYFSIELSEDKIAAEEVEQILAVFKTKKQAAEKLNQLAIDFRLCPKLLGLEKTSSSCFNYQLNRCSGACVGEESSLLYNLRFMEAFSDSRVPAWPYPGVVAIIEERPGFSETHLVYKWCYLGTYSQSREDQKVETQDIRFSWDIYKIIRKALGSKRIKCVSLSDQEVKVLETQYNM